MGKGKAGCQEQAISQMLEGSKYLEIRARWVNCLKDRLQYQLSELLLFETSAADQLLEDIMSRYSSGEGGAEAWMETFIAEFRLSLAQIATNEDHAAGAIKLISPANEVKPEQARQALQELLSQAGNSDQRSRYRHALASVDYQQGQPADARLWLEKDLDDQQVAGKRRSMTSQKLEALADAKPWNLVPPEIFEAGNMSRKSFIDFFAPDSSPQKKLNAARHLVLKLSQAGYINQARQLSLSLLSSVADSPASLRYSAGRIHARVLVAGENYDQAAEIYQSLADQATSGLDVYDDLQSLEKVYDLALMPDLALKAAQQRVKKVSPKYHSQAEGHYLGRLLREGKLNQAVHDASTTKAAIDALRQALRTSPNYAERSYLRYCLSKQLMKDDQIAGAITVMADESMEPQASKVDKQRAQTKIEIFEKILAQQ